MWAEANLILVFAGLVVVVKIDSIVGSENDDNSKIFYPTDVLLHQHHRAPSASHPIYRSLSSGFQHDPNLHRNHGESSSDSHHHHQSNSHNEVLKENASKNDTNKGKSSFNNASVTIPLDFIRNISGYSIDDLLLNFLEEDANLDEPMVIQNRFLSDDGTARNSATMPEKANCIPEYRTLKLVDNNDPSILYIPQCTRVEQCGGCCSHELLSCQPIETETINYMVFRTQYTSNKKLKFLGKQIIPVEKHTKCKCDCKIKKENCTKYQEYQPSDCKCACKNIDEEEKCHKNPGKKLWNPDACACQCRDVLQCSSMSYFDQNECSCLPILMKRQYATYQIRVHDNVTSPAEFHYEEGN